jgi:HrpA-like RNA helicase
MSDTDSGASPRMRPLPIDALLPDVVAALRASPAIVVEAPPGAGKTTRIPGSPLPARKAKSMC